jgi:hypothetical protein
VPNLFPGYRREPIRPAIGHPLGSYHEPILREFPRNNYTWRKSLRKVIPICAETTCLIAPHKTQQVFPDSPDYEVGDVMGNSGFLFVFPLGTGRLA